MKKHRFYKDEYGWAIDLPLFSRPARSMVCGADLLLDQLSNGKSEINLGISSRSIKDWDECISRQVIIGLLKGVAYSSENFKVVNPYNGLNCLWLCPVTLWVFWRYPKKIYIKIV